MYVVQIFSKVIWSRPYYLWENWFVQNINIRLYKSAYTIMMIKYLFGAILNCLLQYSSLDFSFVQIRYCSLSKFIHEYDATCKTRSCQKNHHMTYNCLWHQSQPTEFIWTYLENKRFDDIRKDMLLFDIPSYVNKLRIWKKRKLIIYQNVIRYYSTYHMVRELVCSDRMAMIKIHHDHDQWKSHLQKVAIIFYISN